MAKSFGGRAGSGELSTMLGQDATLDGRLSVKHSVRIDGTMRGEIVSTETVTIGSEGTLEGDITASDVVIGGKVIGKVICSGKVLLEQQSHLTGDLRTVRLVVEEGATFNGMSEMGEEHFTKPVHPPKHIQLEEEEA